MDRGNILKGTERFVTAKNYGKYNLLNFSSDVVDNYCVRKLR